MTCPGNGEGYCENTCSVKSPLLGKNKVLRQQHLQKPSWLETRCDFCFEPWLQGKGCRWAEAMRGAWSCSGTSWTSAACWHCPAARLDQLHCFRLSQAHKANTPPVLAKVTPAMPRWFAKPTVQRANFNKPVLGGLINTLGIASNPGLHALLMKFIYMMGPNNCACNQCN